MTLLQMTDLFVAVKSVLQASSYLAVVVAAWLALLLVIAILLHGHASWAPARAVRADTAPRRRIGVAARSSP